MREPNSLLAQICQDKENMYMKVSMGEKERLTSSMIKDANGSYLVDHDPEYFPHVLSYLRSGRVPSPRKISREGKIRSG